MHIMMTKLIDGHKLTVVRNISAGVGIWFNGYIDGKQVVTTGGLSQDKNTQEYCMELLCKQILETSQMN